jgi:hypothetical protein
MDKHVHHLEHLALYSLVIWQLVLGMRIILKYLVKNWPPMWAKKSEGLPFRDYEVAPYKKKFGAIDVDVNKKIFIDKADKIDVKTDETIKGKVKTQKDKLRKLK